MLLAAAHQCNWEWMLLALSLELGHPLDAAYKPLVDPWAEREMKKVRGRFGCRLIPAKQLLADIIGDTRGRTADGRKIYSLQDIYPHADLVTYPSIVEGFGNAFLEAIYFRKPILVNNYSIYSFDIKPKGFDVIEMDAASNNSVEDIRDLRERVGARVAGGVEACVGPLVEEGLDEALGLAVGPGRIGSGPEVLELEPLAGRGKSHGAVAGAVVGQHSFWPDVVREEPVVGATPEAGRGSAFLVGVDLGVGAPESHRPPRIGRS